LFPRSETAQVMPVSVARSSSLNLAREDTSLEADRVF
jgi:hypothetical protein